jgi:hypothetical protein
MRSIARLHSAIFGLHAAAIRCARDISSGDILLATWSRFLVARS